MSTQVEVKPRGRGRPSSFPEGVETKMAGFNLPVATLELLTSTVEKRNKDRGAKPRTNGNLLVDRAIRAFLRKG